MYLVGVSITYRIYPLHQVAYEGSTVRITCFSTHTPIWLKEIEPSIPLNNIKPFWLTDWNPVNSTLYKDNVVTINNVNEKYSGRYLCEGLNFHGPFKAVSQLFVGGKSMSNL